MMHKYYISLFVILVLSLTYPVILKSQGEEFEFDPQPETNSEQKKTFQSKDLEIHELLETLRESQLVKELRLPKEKAQAVIAKMRYARKLRKGYLFRRYAIENELDALLNLSAPDQTQITDVLQKLEIAKLQYYQQIIATDEELQKILTPKERAKYVLFQRNFNRKLKEVIANIRRQTQKTSSQTNQILRRQNSESVIR